MDPFEMAREAQQKQTKKDKEKQIQDFLEKAFELLDESYNQYETIKKRPPLKTSDALYQERERYEEFILKYYIKLSRKVLHEIKNNSNSLIAFSLRTVYELFFKKLMFFLNKNSDYEKAKFLFVLRDIMLQLKDDFPDWFEKRKAKINNYLTEDEVNKLLELVSKIKNGSYDQKDFLRYTPEPTAILNNDKKKLLESLRFKFMDLEGFYFYYCQKIHGNPFMLETFLNNSERIKYQAYILLYQSSLNCLSLLLETDELNENLKTKIQIFLNKEEDRDTIKNKLADGYNAVKNLEQN